MFVPYFVCFWELGAVVLNIGLNESIRNPNPTTTTVDVRMESMTAVDKSIEQKALSTMSANGESAKPFTIPEFIKLRLYPQFFSVMCVDTRTKLRAWSGSGKCTTIHMEEPFWRMIWVWERRCKWLSICGACMLAVKSTPA